jgi:peptide/nickel transport system ATP-binding protein
MLDVENLSVSFSRYQGLLRRRDLTVLNGVDVTVQPGELVAMIGQSGGGKSLLAHAVLGILPRNARQEGRLTFEGQVLDTRLQKKLRGHRMVLVPQSVTWLDPTASAGRQVGWGARAAGRDPSRDAVAHEFARHGLEREAMALFPHQLSGGMARRVLTAIATMAQADLLIADEPTSGLDPSVRSMALTLLRRLADEGRAVLVISHDLSAVLPVADHVTVLHNGRTVEIAPGAMIRETGPRHPYSKALWAALPENGFNAAPGSIGNPGQRDTGRDMECGFLETCGSAIDQCQRIPPPWNPGPGMKARCHCA